MKINDLYDLLSCDTFNEVAEKINEQAFGIISKKLDGLISRVDVDDWNDAHETKNEPTDDELHYFAVSKILEDFTTTPKFSKQEALESGMCIERILFGHPSYWGRVIKTDEKYDKLDEFSDYDIDRTMFTHSMIDELYNKVYELIKSKE
jgi:hypothetical protein